MKPSLLDRTVATIGAVAVFVYCLPAPLFYFGFTDLAYKILNFLPIP